MVEIIPELEPELEPEEEVTIRAAPRVGMLAIFTVCLGIILSVQAIVQGFFGSVNSTVGWIPFAGKVITQPIHKIEQKIVSFLSGLERDLDSGIAHNFHQLARLMDKLVDDLEQAAVAIILLGALATGAVVTYAIPALVRLVHKIEKEVEHVVKPAVERVTKIERVTKHIYVHEVYPKVRVIEHRVENMLRHDLKRLRADSENAIRKAEKAEKLAEKAEHVVATKAFEAAVAASLAKLGLDALRCSNLGNLFKSKGCSLWGDLENLLGLAAAALALESVCDFLPLVEDAFGAVIGPVVALLNQVPLGSCEQVPKGWASLNVAAGPLPPAQTLGPFPD
jgi:hypothetical protein